MLDRPTQRGVAVLDAGRCRILRSQTVLGADDDAPVPPQPRDNGRQAIETAPHHQPSPVQREEQGAGAAHAGALGASCNRGGKCRPILTKDVHVLQVDVGVLEQKTRPDFVSRYAPARDLLHRHGSEDAERLDALEQSGGGTVVGRTGGELLMRARHAVTVAL